MYHTVSMKGAITVSRTTWRGIAAGLVDAALVLLPIPALLTLLVFLFYAMLFPIGMFIEVAEGGTVDPGAILVIMVTSAVLVSATLSAIPLVAWTARVLGVRCARSGRRSPGMRLFGLGTRPVDSPDNEAFSTPDTKAHPVSRPRRVLAVLTDTAVALAPAGWPAFLVASWVAAARVGDAGWWPDGEPAGLAWGLSAWAIMTWAGFMVPWIAWVRNIRRAHCSMHDRRTLGHRIAGIR